MRIYDAATPEGRKVNPTGRAYCQRCEGRDGRHGLVNTIERKENAKGRMQARKVVRDCPNGQLDSGVDTE